MSRLATDIQRRSELRKFMGGDIDELIAKMERQEIHRMQAREIHWKVMKARSTSSVVEIAGEKTVRHSLVG